MSNLPEHLSVLIAYVCSVRFYVITWGRFRVKERVIWQTRVSSVHQEIRCISDGSIDRSVQCQGRSSEQVRPGKRLICHQEAEDLNEIFIL